MTRWSLLLGPLAVAAGLVAPAAARAGAPVAANAVWNGVFEQSPIGPPEEIYPLGGDVTAKQAAFAGDASDDLGGPGTVSSGLVIGSDGKLYTFGADEAGEAGNGKEGLFAPLEQISLPGGAKPAQVAISYEANSAVLATNGDIYTAGVGALGYKANGSQDTFSKVTLPEGATATEISDGGNYMLAVGSNGKIYAWGYDGDGRLGNGTTTATELPEAVSLPDGVSATAVAAGEYGDGFAIGSNGELYSWGYSYNGSALGDGESQESRSVPEPVDLPNGVKVTAVSTSGEDAYAVTSTGKLYGWGANYYGYLGDGTSTRRATPELIELTEDAAARSVFAGNGINLVTGTNGKVYSDGLNYQYALGYATRGEAEEAQTTFKAVALPEGFTATSAVIGTWGLGNAGGFAIGTTTKPPVPKIRPPIFTEASPPTSLAPGAELSYTFAASDSPTFSLADAPSWLSIDSQTGELSGTAPSELILAGYSVVATNSAGSTTAGPFYVTAPGATVAVKGAVEGPNAVAVVGATVDACAIGSSYCLHTTTDAEGKFEFHVQPALTITLTAYPPAGSDYLSGGIGPVRVLGGGLSDQILELTQPPLDVAESLGIDYGGVPILDFIFANQVTLKGCPYGIATVSVIGNEIGHEGPEGYEAGPGTFHFYALPETSPGSGTYSGELPAQYPIHGPAEIDESVNCPPESNLLPSVGPANGGTTVNVTGTGLADATRVEFGSTPAPSFQVVGEEDVQAVAPAGTGTVPVTVTTPEGPQVLGEYTYQAVESVEPNSGPEAGGTTVTILGTGLEDADQVDFGGVEAESITQVSSSEIEAVSPPGSGTVDVTVHTDLGGPTPTSAADLFTYTAEPAAARAGLHHSRRAAGTGDSKPVPPYMGGQAHWAAAANAGLLAIDPAASGPASLFASPFDERFAGELARPSLTLTAALGRKLARLVVANAPEIAEQIIKGGTVAQAVKAHEEANVCELGVLVVSAVISPVISAAVKVIIEGYTPTITLAVGAALGAVTGGLGWGIAAATPVILHYIGAYLSDKLVETAVKAIFAHYHCGEEGQSPFVPNVLIDPSGLVLDKNGDPVSGAAATILRSNTYAGPFAAVEPTEPGIEPTENPEQTGSGGQFAWEVDAGFYEVQASKSGCWDPYEPSNSTSTIGPYPVPPPQTGLIVTLACSEEPPAPTPIVTSLSASTGPTSGGTAVRVTGSGFTPTTTVSFGGTAAQSTKFVSPDLLEVVSPAGSGSENVVVDSAGGESATSPADEFFFGSAPTVTGLSQSEGPTAGGTKLTITGTGFTGATVVGFGALPVSSFTVLSGTEIQVTTPEYLAGIVEVTVSTPAGASAATGADRFTYVVPSPGSASGGGSGSTGNHGSSGGGAGGGSSPVATTATAGKATIKGATASLLVSCAGASSATCSVAVTLYVTETVKGGKVVAIAAKAKPKTTTRTVTVGTATVTLDAGHSELVAVSLNSTGKNLLKVHHTLATRLTVSLGTSVLSNQTVTFKPPATKKSKTHKG